MGKDGASQKAFEDMVHTKGLVEEWVPPKAIFQINVGNAVVWLR